MMIVIPDPHPGRCLNYRQGHRCLHYNNHDSACVFNEKESDPFGWQFETRGWQYTQKTPEPWVSPLTPGATDEG